MLRWRIMGCIALALAVGHSIAQTKSLPSNEANKATIPPINVIVTQPAKSEAERAAESKERDEKLALDRQLVDFNHDLARYTGIMALVAMLQLFALAWQTKYLGAALKESKRAGDIANASMIAGNRAMVVAQGLKAWGTRDSVSGQYAWAFRPQWRNAGRTPTRDMRMFTQCELRETPLPDVYDFPLDDERNIGTALIPPDYTTEGSLAPHVPHPNITPQQIADVQRGTKHLYLWGWARYKDVFDDAAEHVTKFCWVVLPDGDPFDGKLEGVRFDRVLHKGGNYAD